jgi:hypothetical protein
MDSYVLSSCNLLRRACETMQAAVPGLLEAADLCIGPVRIGVLCTLYHVLLG